MKKFLLFIFTAFVSLLINAQVTSEPFPLQESAQDVKIFFHADQGNKGLMNVAPTTKVYAHTWAILDNGTSTSAPNWNGTYADKYQLTYVGDNVWQLYIGDIRSYYGVTSATRHVAKLGFVFRDATGNLTGRGDGGADIFIDVVDSGLQIVLEASETSSLITPYNQTVKFSATTTEDAKITIDVNGTTIASGDGTQLIAEYTFPTFGDYDVVATATNGEATVSASRSYCYVKASTEMAYPGGKPQMGPVKNADGSVTFCLGAPLKHSVMIVGAWNNYAIENDQVMYYTDVDDLRYFWITIQGLENDKRYGYYFIVDGATPVGDPYARLVLDPWNDKYLTTGVFPGLPAYPFSKIDGVPLAVYQGNINDYDWKVTDFKGVEQTDLIIYEMLFRDFTGTEGQARGNGTVRKAIEKLPYLIELGVNAVELLPIMEFNGNNSWGYNPNFYFAIDKAYGTPDDYKEFIDLCHQNGIAVILDMVFNQSDGLHPWYQMYMPGANPFYNLDAPHAYSVLNDWNQGNPMVQEQFRDVLRYWLEEYKFDGFRFDLVKGLGDNSSYASSSESATNAYNQSRIDRMIGFTNFIKEINPNAYCINEDLAFTNEENAMARVGMLNWANVNEAARQFAMGYQSNSNLNRLYATNDGGRLWGSTVSYLESHDEQRLAYSQDQWGAAGVKGDVKVSMQRCGSAAAQMILAPGAHMIWQFSEMGNAENTKNDYGNNTSPKKVTWNLLDDPDHRGLYESYCQLIAIRNKNKEMFTQDAYFTMACNSTNWSKGRNLYSNLGDYELYTFINPNVTGEITFDKDFLFSSNDAYQIMSKSYDSEPSFDAASGTVTVPANCYVVIGSKELDSEKDATVRPGSDCALEAYGADGEIVVAYVEGPAEIFGLDGSRIATAESGSTVSVAAGIYIVRCGGASAKVIVK